MSMCSLQCATAGGVQPAPWDMPFGGVQWFKGQECFHSFSKTLLEPKQSPFWMSPAMEWKWNCKEASPCISWCVHTHFYPWAKSSVLQCVLIYITNQSTVLIILVMSLHNRNLLKPQQETGEINTFEVQSCASFSTAACLKWCKRFQNIWQEQVAIYLSICYLNDNLVKPANNNSHKNRLTYILVLKELSEPSYQALYVPGSACAHSLSVVLSRFPMQCLC